MTLLTVQFCRRISSLYIHFMLSEVVALTKLLPCRESIEMVANSVPNGTVKAGDKIVNDVKLTNLPAGRFDGILRPYSQADVDKLR